MLKMKKNFKSAPDLQKNIFDKKYFVNKYNKALKKNCHFLVFDTRKKKEILIGNDIVFYDNFMIVKNNSKSISLLYSDLVLSIYKIEVV